MGKWDKYKKKKDDVEKKENNNGIAASNINCSLLNSIKKGFKSL